jgi:hypothetical protein
MERTGCSGQQGLLPEGARTPGCHSLTVTLQSLALLILLGILKSEEFMTHAHSSLLSPSSGHPGLCLLLCQHPLSLWMSNALLPAGLEGQLELQSRGRQATRQESTGRSLGLLSLAGAWGTVSPQERSFQTVREALPSGPSHLLLPTVLCWALQWPGFPHLQVLCHTGRAWPRTLASHLQYSYRQEEYLRGKTRAQMGHKASHS